MLALLQWVLIFLVIPFVFLVRSSPLSFGEHKTIKHLARKLNKYSAERTTIRKKMWIYSVINKLLIYFRSKMGEKKIKLA